MLWTGNPTVWINQYDSFRNFRHTSVCLLWLLHVCLYRTRFSVLDCNRTVCCMNFKTAFSLVRPLTWSFIVWHRFEGRLEFMAVREGYLWFVMRKFRSVIILRRKNINYLLNIIKKRCKDLLPKFTIEPRNLVADLWNKWLSLYEIVVGIFI